jgi:hypothetical protein
MILLFRPFVTGIVACLFATAAIGTKWQTDYDKAGYQIEKSAKP